MRRAQDPAHAPVCTRILRPLHGSAYLLLPAGHVEVVEQLIAAGADSAIHNGKNWTAVHSAASGGHFEAVLRLVQSGAAWRPLRDLDVIKLLTRKTSLKCGPACTLQLVRRGLWPGRCPT